MSEYVDLGVLGGPDAGRGAGLAVLLPGFAARFAMPLLLSAGGVTIEHGWRTRLVDWEPPQNRGWDAVWLDPLLHRPEVAEAIARHPGRQLLIGGTADPVWRSDVAAESGADVLEIPDADHGLVIAGDAVGSAEIHVDITRRIKAWVRSPEPLGA